MRLGVKLAIPFVLALLIIGGVGIWSYMGIQEGTEANRWVAHTQEVMGNLDRVVKALDDAETGQRGFLLTSEDRYLEPYNAAAGEIRKDIDKVASLTGDNPGQQRDIQRLGKLAGDKLDELRETIDLNKQGKHEQALQIVRSDRGEKIMDDIRKLVDGMAARERPLLEKEKIAASEAASQTVQTVTLGVLLSLLVLGVAAVIALRALRTPAPGTTPESAGRKWPGIVIRYAFAVGIVALATAVRWWLDQHFGTNAATFITWYPAVLLVASVAGGGPGIFATLLSGVIADYWFIPPYGHFGIDRASDAVALGIFTGTCVAWSLLAEMLRRSRYAQAVAATQERELALLNMGNLMALDLDHRIVRWSDGNRRLYGFDAGEAKGQLTHEFLQTHFDQPLKQIMAELHAKGYWQGEVTRRAKDGTQLSLSLLWALRRDELGKPLAILEVSTDITPQKAAEESLRQQSEELAQQNEELTQQTEELSRQSEELTQQSEELSEQNEELQTQSEEIQAMNAELGHREKTLQTLLDSARLPVGEQDVMGQMCQAAMEMVGRPAIGAVVCERRGEELHIIAHAGFDGAGLPVCWTVQGSNVELVIQQDRTASLEDTSLRPDLNILNVRGRGRFGAVLSSPLRLQGQPIGAVSIFSDGPHPWTAEQFRLIEWLAAKCSNTLEAMRLAQQVRHAQIESDTASEFLKIINQSTDTRTLVHEAVTFFHRQTDCEAVGVRLKDGDDYPYYEAHGFPEEFVRLENSLCERDVNGNVQRDSAGNVCIACMCGNVICGRFDPSKPFFSPKGSFWSNGTSELLATSTEADRKAKTRNRCNGQGYESVALIALQVGDERLGLLQLNDKRKGMFTAQTIALWERLANYMAVALAKLRAEEALHATVWDLERSNKELEQFAYIASHDLQEPLRQVRAFVQLLRDRHADKFDGQAEKFFQFVHEGAARMSDLVQGLLAYSRVGAKDAAKQPIPCQKVLDTALANLQAGIAESRATVTHDDLPTVQAEPTQLTQLFQNLIGNAVKFRRDGEAPRIHVGCRRDDGHWLFRVQDNGIGIDPEFHEKVFLIFQRLHGREKYPGTGIGLAICKKIVEQHGGRIWIDSKVGEGSTFCFTLPE
jgi:PAS domain S-box-containing protein